MILLNVKVSLKYKYYVFFISICLYLHLINKQFKTTIEIVKHNYHLNAVYLHSTKIGTLYTVV